MSLSATRSEFNNYHFQIIYGLVAIFYRKLCKTIVSAFETLLRVSVAVTTFED